MLNNEQRKELAKRLAKNLREDEANYISPQHKESEDYWRDKLARDLESWITQFNDEI